MILLTDEEIIEAYAKAVELHPKQVGIYCYDGEGGLGIAKAQLKKVVEELKQYTEGDIYGGTNMEEYMLFQIPYKEWQALLKECE